MVSGFQEQENTPRKKGGGKSSGKGKILFLAIVIVGLCAYAVQSGGIKGKLPFGAGKSDKQAENLIAQNQQKGLESLQQDPAGGNVQSDANDIYAQTLDLQGKSPNTASTPANAPSQTAMAPKGSKRQSVQVPVDDVDIMSSKSPGKSGGKTIKIAVTEGGRSNPFLPDSENVLPASLGNLSLTYPPEQLATGSEASKVMDTTISGILYDKYSPSAIVQFGGSDYLVKKGDIINKYRVLAIYKDKVVVQLGKNIYKAGVGELLELDKVNYNTIANLEKKFGGNNVSINVKKKGY